MGIKIGNLDLSNIYVGNSQVSKVYVGNVLKWSSGPTIKAGDYAFPLSNITSILFRYNSSFDVTINMGFTSNSETFSSITFIYTKTTTSGETNWTMKYDDTVVATATYGNSAITYTTNAYRVINVPSNVSISEETLELFNTVAKERMMFLKEAKINYYMPLFYTETTAGSTQQFVSFSVNYRDYYSSSSHSSSFPKLYVSYDGGTTRTYIADGTTTPTASNALTQIFFNITSIDTTKQNIMFIVELIVDEYYDIILSGTQTISVECAGVVSTQDLDLSIVDNMFYKPYSLTRVGIRDRDRTIKHPSIFVNTLTGEYNYGSKVCDIHANDLLPIARTYNLECAYFPDNEGNYLINSSSFPVYKNKTLVQSTEQTKLIVYVSGTFSTGPQVSFKAESGQSGTLTCDGVTYSIDDANYVTITGLTHGLHEIDCTCEFYGILSTNQASTSSVDIISTGTKFLGGSSYYSSGYQVPTANNLNKCGNGLANKCSGVTTSPSMGSGVAFINNGTTFNTPVSFDLSGYMVFINEDSSNANPSIPTLTAGSNKSTKSYIFLTDNAALRSGLISQAGSYTTVTVYHLDGTDWS